MATRCIFFVWIGIFCAFPVLAAEVDATNSIKVAKYDDRDLFLQKKPDTSPQVKVKEKFDYYDIDGATPDDLLAQMKRNGTKWNDGKVYAALTTWDIRYDYDIISLNGRYYLSSIKTDVDIVFHLPRLAPSATTPDRIVNLWKTYIANLTKHEAGHRDLAISTGREIYETLASIGSSTSKGELEKEAKSLIKAKLQRLKEVQIEYDAETHHGETQGAILAPPGNSPRLADVHPGGSRNDKAVPSMARLDSGSE